MFKYPKCKTAELARFPDPLPPGGGSGNLTRAINFFQGGTVEEEETSGTTTQHIRHSRWGKKDIKRTKEIKKDATLESKRSTATRDKSEKEIND